MGICCSSETTSIATAKLILHDGRLQEFPYPVKVSFVLQKHPTYFICNSDDMEFNDVVYSMHDDEVLQPGHLYFALPLNRLKRRMKAEEMAALAVKASSVLAKCNGKEKCGFVLTEKQTEKVGDVNGVREVVVRGRSGGGSSRRGGKFTAELNVIME